VSAHEDEDGIDGPFDRAMDRAMKDDAKAARKAAPLPPCCRWCGGDGCPDCSPFDLGGEA
jgi:hypothetical protein